MSDNDWRFGILNCCLRSYAAWPEHRNFPFVNIHCFTVIRFHNVINTDLNGQFFTCREVVRQSMKPNQYGRIIMVSSIHGVCGRKGVDTAPYAAAKGGIVIAVADALQIPVKFVGVGEQADDLMPFSAKEFVEALI